MQKVKTLSQLKRMIGQAQGVTGTTAYRPKGGDEQRFFDKHTIEVTDDANGNDDEMFKGTKVKKIDRASEKHGYDSPDDQRVHEETELEERELSTGEMKKREDYVKGMKKSMKDFKSRYGEDAKSVMYATATKMAKEDFEYQIDEEINVDLLEFYLQLDEDNRMLMAEMLDKGLGDQIMKLIAEDREVENG